MGYIYLQPVGDIAEEILRYLGTKLEEVYGYQCKLAPRTMLPDSLYSPKRRQYNASVLVEVIAGKIPDDAEKLLGVVDVDIFVPGMNFIFGLAIGNVSIISLTRLRPEYYGEKENEFLFKERTLKEAVHELGHTFGLRHCPDINCVMHFSNCLPDTDVKGTGFCSNCSRKLRHHLKQGY